MPELHDELRTLAEQIAACEDDAVAEFAADAADRYRAERLIVLGLHGVDAMVGGGPEIAEDDPRLEAVRVRLRDRLRALVEWGKKTGRMT